MSGPGRSVLGLGSNLGDRVAHLQAALDLVGQAFPVLAVSPVVETVPVGGPEQPDYLNAVLVLAGEDGPALLRAARAAEKAAGRERGTRWGPRTLDVDVLTCGTRRSNDPELTLPHPRAHERAFVLVPWAAVDPYGCLPGHGPVIEVLAALPDTVRAGVRWREDLALSAPGRTW